MAAATCASTASYAAGEVGRGADPWPSRSTAIVSRPASASRSSQPGCRQLCSADEAKPCTSSTGQASMLVPLTLRDPEDLPTPWSSRTFVITEIPTVPRGPPGYLDGAPTLSSQPRDSAT